eukprot:TRINITY_DN14190_c0_g1_i3.p3 TRINITY_DN14190_c0_g1~~TRINITY_DN14190_c0_g1_i3.p3  ORF type:complete len:162 (-),score=42.39 TRINITY_DN14190_c0_g1_i3:140-625(-)
MEAYQKAIQIDNLNEIVFGNMALIYLKLNNNDQCIEYCNHAISKIKCFTSNTNFNPKMAQSSQNCNKLLVKIYLRKSQAELNKNLLNDAYESIKQVIQIDEMNKEARTIQKQIELELQRKETQSSKAKAAELIKNTNYKEALLIYQACLKKIIQQLSLIHI